MKGLYLKKTDTHKALRLIRFGVRGLFALLTLFACILAWQLNDGFSNDEFWQFVKGGKGLTPEEYEARLMTLGQQDLLHYEAFFSHYHATFDFDDSQNEFEIWHLGFMANGGIGDDAWTDFQTWIILQGKDVFHDAFRDAESLIEPILAADRLIATEDWNGCKYKFSERFPDYETSRFGWLKQWDQFRLRRALRGATDQETLLSLREVTHSRPPGYPATNQELADWYPKAAEAFGYNE